MLRSASSFSNRSFSRSNEGGSLGSASTEVTHSRRRLATLSSTERVANWRNPFIRLSRNASFDMLWRATPTMQNGFGNNSPTARLYKEGMTSLCVRSPVIPKMTKAQDCGLWAGSKSVMNSRPSV